MHALLDARPRPLTLTRAACTHSKNVGQTSEQLPPDIPTSKSFFPIESTVGPSRRPDLAWLLTLAYLSIEEQSPVGYTHEVRASLALLRMFSSAIVNGRSRVV